MLSEMQTGAGKLAILPPSWKALQEPVAATAPLTKDQLYQNTATDLSVPLPHQSFLIQSLLNYW